MSFYINIAFIGAQSSGKSTLLNSILRHDLTSCGPKGKTMIPQIYRETDVTDFSSIKENSEKANLDSSIKMIVHEIPKNVTYLNKTDVDERILFQFYDLPEIDGDNLKWATANFHRFDIIVFVSDYNSCMNSDEINILEWIIECMQIEYENGKNIRLVPVMNKWDMNENNADFFDKVNDILYKKAHELEVDHSFIRISSELSFIYTNLFMNEKNVLSQEYIDKLGCHEFGIKKWKMFSDEDKLTHINAIVKDLLSTDESNNIKIKVILEHIGYHDVILNIKHEISQASIIYNKIIDDVYTIKEIRDIKSFIENVTCIFSKYFDLFSSDLFQTSIESDFLITSAYDKINENLTNLIDEYLENETVNIANVIVEFNKKKNESKSKYLKYISLIDMLINKMNEYNQIIGIIRLIESKGFCVIINMNVIKTYIDLVQKQYFDIIKNVLLDYEFNQETYHNRNHVVKVIKYMKEYCDNEKVKQFIIKFLKRVVSLDDEKFNMYFMDIGYENIITVSKNIMTKKSHIKLIFAILYKYIGINVEHAIENKEMENYIVTINLYLQSIKSQLKPVQYYVLNKLLDEIDYCNENIYSDINKSFLSLNFLDNDYDIEFEKRMLNYLIQSN